MGSEYENAHERRWKKLTLHEYVVQVQRLLRSKEVDVSRLAIDPH